MYILLCKDFISLITLVSDNVNSSAVLTPAANGFQLLGTDPGTATSEVRTTPDNLLIIVVPSFYVRSPATNKLPNDCSIPQVTETGFLEDTVICTSSLTDKFPKTITVVLVEASVYV